MTAQLAPPSALTTETAVGLLAVVDYVTDDLGPTLEHMQGRAFAENHPGFTIASATHSVPAGSGQQVLTIT